MENNNCLSVKKVLFALHCLPFRLSLHHRIKLNSWTYRRFIRFI
ncbi:hypothetical protein HMPREF0973_02941 [Prevotella veroralis F0319]|uniref:Uncharacterized protein n=1 Tax=Prevotella veroralis F0319 TaxID=649761 RepID=C9MTG5_9BACT|nr:hypothetical protein HMPREF0973_02941 [Prevotella veroralis F0319]